MNAFINALKQQANTVQANIKNKPVKPKNEALPHDYSDGNYQVTKQNGQYFIKPTIADLKTTDSKTFWDNSASSIKDANITHVDLVNSHNRIDIFFDMVPSNSQRHSMKQHGFRYNPDRVCWYHKDTPLNRKFLFERFNVMDLDIDDKESESITVGQIQAIKPMLEIQDTAKEKPDYIVYKKQIAELLQVLNCDFADLPLIAVNCLYEKTFN